jgi:hypothetical protein
MNARSIGMLAIALSGLVLAQTPAAQKKQTAKAAASKTYTPPKTAWGDPDIQGMWPGELHAPLQRPKNLQDKLELTEEEFAAQLDRNQKAAAVDNEQFAKADARVGIGPPSYWTERGRPSKQTSLIVDPPDGQLPTMTPEGKKLHYPGAGLRSDPPGDDS